LPSEGDVRSVESFSGSIGKISAAVQTEVVSVRAWPSNAEPFFTIASTSATATKIFTTQPGSAPRRKLIKVERINSRLGKNRARCYIAAVALANKNARVLWALLAHNEDYQAPAAA
jgi:hypothetical protein